MQLLCSLNPVWLSTSNGGPLLQPPTQSGHRQSLCSVPLIHLVFDVISQVYEYIYGSNQRYLSFATSIKESGLSSRHQLVKFCETSRVEQNDSIIVFLELLPAVAKFLRQTQDGQICHRNCLMWERDEPHSTTKYSPPVNSRWYSLCLFHHEWCHRHRF